VSSHTFRKTVASRLDDQGFSIRHIADQLGHARPSTMLDHYLGRRAITTADFVHFCSSATVTDVTRGDRPISCLVSDAGRVRLMSREATSVSRTTKATGQAVSAWRAA
jgi:hypothetical protein